jgi:hypothetical protein
VYNNSCISSLVHVLYRNESEYIQNVVEHVTRVLNKIVLDPEKRSRVWRREEVFDILSKYKVITSFLLENTTVKHHN